MSSIIAEKAGFMISGYDVKLVANMRHRCPNCRKVINRALLEQSRGEKFYPFCSNRCKLIDLGRWLDSDYRIVSEPKPEDGGQKTDDRMGKGNP